MEQQNQMQAQYQFIDQLRGRNNEEALRSGRPKQVCIHTFGCQMNENDSEKLLGMLSEMGYTETDRREEADMIIFNTCCVREHAEEKVYGHLGALKKLKEERPGMIIAVCGCMPQQPTVAEEIKKTYKQVDLVFGTHNLHRLPEMMFAVVVHKKRVIEIWDAKGEVTEHVPISRKDGVKAWLTVMYGCNNFCTYCIVPYVRGRERSRKPEDILEEAESLAKMGYKEITLLGQNVNSYGKDLDVGRGSAEKYSFADLLRLLNRVEGIERIRFMTSHPKDLNLDLIYAMKDCEKVAENLHLPIQSGSTSILKEMNRKYSQEEYLALIKKIKEIIPGISLTTDMIVGFPGETEVDFRETLRVVETVGFDSAFTFLYSRRKGTPAAEYAAQVPEDVKKERFARLVALQNKISREKNDAYLNRVTEVLVEGESKTNADVLTGRTRDNKIVNFTIPGQALEQKLAADAHGGKNEKAIEMDIWAGQLVHVRIDSVGTWALQGECLPVDEKGISV